LHDIVTMAETIVAAASNLPTAVSHAAPKPSEGKKNFNSRWNKSKKRKIEDVEMEDANGAAVEEEVMKAPKKHEEKEGEAMAKKSKKAGKGSSKGSKEAVEGGEKPEKKRRKVNKKENSDATKSKEEAEGDEGSGKKARFIVFIGKEAQLPLYYVANC